MLDLRTCFSISSPQMSSLYLWAVFTFIVLAAIMWHLMSDEVRFPVEGLWTLVAFIFPLLRVTQRVGLQTRANPKIVTYWRPTKLRTINDWIFQVCLMLSHSPLEVGKHLVTFLTLMGTVGNVERLQVLWILSLLVTIPFKENDINQEKCSLFVWCHQSYWMFGIKA